MEVLVGIILAALGLWIAFKLLVWALVALRIIFQLCVAPLIAGAITWWLWDNVWIGVGIGAAIVLFITIKEGGLGWVFDNDSSSSSGSYTGSRTSSVSAPDIPEYDRNASANRKYHLQVAESYQSNYEYNKQKAEERLRQAKTYMSEADYCRNKASLYDDTSYLDEARRYEEMAGREIDEAQSFCREAERYQNLANEAIHTANMCS